MKPSARDRLLEAADRLFYNEGVHRVGIDRVLAEAGVAKGSLYYNFGGRDDLVRTYLANRHAKWAEAIAGYQARVAEPEDKILAIFDALADLFGEPGFRGCAFLNAAAEAAPGSAEQIAVKDFRTWLHELFAVLVAAAGFTDVPRLSAQLVLLYDGANIAAQLDANPRTAQDARVAAEAIMAAARR